MIGEAWSGDAPAHPVTRQHRAGGVQRKNIQCTPVIFALLTRTAHDPRCHTGQREVNPIVKLQSSIDHSLWQINPIFIVLFKPILDPAA
jgi:hypothetical protein